MNAAARPWIGIVFKCLAALALIFAFVFFMRMQEEQSANDKLRGHGVVSRALVTDMKLDKTVYEGRRGNSRTVDHQILQVRHAPKSPVKYADFPARVKAADLPAAPPLTGDPMKDSENLGVMFVSKELYQRTKVGDMLIVANTPWDSTSPVPVEEVEAFDASVFYPRIAIALGLTLVFWLIGRRVGKVPA